jgi:sulfhydrogenase subunit beta (sulfur reductase)
MDANIEARGTLDRAGLDALLAELVRQGYQVVGPRVRDGAIVYDRIASLAELPRGTGDEQAPGRYRLVKRGDEALFGYAVGPHAWKRFLHPARERLFRVTREQGGMAVTAEPADERWAFLGVRPCELAAIGIQDRVFTGGAHVDARYAARRAAAFIISVQCAVAGGTCFCASMGTGPRAAGGFDLALTELVDGESHRFVVEVGSEAGARVLAAVRPHDTRPADVARCTEITREVTARMGRSLDTEGLHDALVTQAEHPRWQEVAQRCLTCANCTMSCPTCFCSTVEDTSDLSGTHAERWKRWDSCFTMDFTSLHGGSVRASPLSRYRQWLTHKLATWHDQFGSSGCVGCGRCITWCPVGIDLTEEARAISGGEK